MIFDVFSCDLYRRCLQRMSLRQARVGTVYASHLIPFSYWYMQNSINILATESSQLYRHTE